jgi:methionine-gamma-lyase
MTQRRRNGPLGFKTRAIRHGYKPGEHHDALGVPVYLTSTYAFASVAENEAVATGELPGAIYGREDNPTTALLEARVAELEGLEAGVAFASGMAACGSLMFSLLAQGDEIIVHRTLYSNTYALMHEALPRFGVRVVPVDMADPANLDGVLSTQTRMVYFETPVNPTAEVLDIAAIAQRAHAVGARVVVDSTFASPAVQRPAEHGADLVLHSLTKYINGHGDLLGGILLGDAATIARIRSRGLRYITGATLSPFAAYLTLRGMKTLALRMSQHARSAQAVAEMLHAHPAVRGLRYPCLPDDPGYAAALRQMSNGSGMISFALRGGGAAADTMMDRLQLVSRAVSLGDAESLIMRPGGLLRAERKKVPHVRLAEGVDEDMMRLSVGLEDTDDILDDLEQALEGL